MLPVMLLTLTILSGCESGRIKFDPDAYRASSRLQAIINEDQIKVQCNEPKFDQFAAMHLDKWVELRKILQEARIPSKLMKDKTKLIGKINNIIKSLKEKK